MDTVTSWLYVAGGLVGLFLGGEGLVRGAARLALRLGMTPLTVGLTVVACGTSSPELFVSLKAVLGGQPDIAVGNVVGSNIGNIGLILAICALASPLRVALQVLRVDMPVVVGVSLVAVAMMADGVIARWEAALLAAGLVAYLGWVLRAARRQPVPKAVEAEFDEAAPRPGWGVVADLAFIGGGLVLLVLGARYMVEGASDIARTFGLSEAVIGLTMVSVGTSLPELAASLVASLRGKGDIAVGNIVGSSLFNLLGILGVTGLVRPLVVSGVGGVDLAVMIGFSVVLLPLMRSGFVVRRWEGVVLLAGYLGYLAWLLR